MKFTKMQGIGNDYVYVNCFEETVKDPAAVARYVSDRHFGIGSDGLILIKPSDIADCEMDMYNLDGSQGAMCGNGIRCVAKYVYDYGIVKKEEHREIRLKITGVKNQLILECQTSSGRQNPMSRKLFRGLVKKYNGKMQEKKEKTGKFGLTVILSRYVSL